MIDQPQRQGGIVQRIKDWWLGTVAPAPMSAAAAPDAKPKGLPSAPEALAAARRAKGQVRAEQIFHVQAPPPGVIPKRSEKRVQLAMDEAQGEMSVWAAGTYASGWFDGPLFIGYPALSLLAVLPEYRRMAEVLSTECTREWIRLLAVDDDAGEKADKITKLETELKRIDLRGHSAQQILMDAFFGLSHLYLDVGTDPDDRKELKQSIGDGRDAVTQVKFAKQIGFLKGLKSVEPVWCYPSKYNATNPLRDDWYRPESWFVQGFEVHSTRLLTFIGRDVPDLLKPAYMFGGISLSQLMKPYVDRWITVVQAVADIIVSFSTSGIKTNLETSLKPTGGNMSLFDRIELFNLYRTNRGAMVLNEDEEFFQFNTPLAGLDELVSKYQEFLCSMSGTPVVKLLGIQPAGLNSSSEGEITSWLDWCEAFRQKFFGPAVTTIIDFAQLSLFGEVDPDITWTWENLRSLDPKEETERRKIDAETDATYSELGAVSPQEIRAKILRDPESPYFGIDEVAAEEDDLMGPEGQAVDPEMAAQFPQLGAPAESGMQASGSGGAEEPTGDPRQDRRAPGEARERPDDSDGARSERRMPGEHELTGEPRRSRGPRLKVRSGSVNTREA